MNPTDPNSPRIGRRAMAVVHLIGEHQNEVDRLQARLDTATAHVDELRGQRDAARAAEERSWPVLEAAEAYATAYAAFSVDDPRAIADEAYARAQDANEALLAAVDAWRAAQPDQTAPTDRPPSDLSQDQGADDGAGTEGSQAQVGAQGDCGECYDIAHDEMDEREFCDRHAELAPTDPAGLDAAISDGIVAAGAAVDAYVGDGSRPPAAVIIGLSVRAAAPHLRAAALREAADDVARLTAGPAPTSQWGEGYRSGVL